MKKQKLNKLSAMAVALAATTLITIPQAAAEPAGKQQGNVAAHYDDDLYGGRHDERRRHDIRDDDYDDHDDDEYRARRRDGDKERHRGHSPRTAIVDCASNDYKASRCRLRVGFDVRDARIIKRRSSADCDRDVSWRLEGNTLWVRDGCRAVFEVSNDYYRDRRHGGYRIKNRDPWAGHDRRYGYQETSRRERRSAVYACEAEAQRFAYSRGRSGAAYVYRPDVQQGRRGALRVSGKIKTWGRGGPRYVYTSCKVRHGYVVDFNVHR